MVTVAGSAAERFLIVSHTAASGLQVRAAACCGVSLGNWFVFAMQLGSISPVRRRSPFAIARIRPPPPANEISIRHRLAAAALSRHTNAGGPISGGKIDPSAG
jgi:hypothetical protein